MEGGGAPEERNRLHYHPISHEAGSHKANYLCDEAQFSEKKGRKVCR